MQGWLKRDTMDVWVEVARVWLTEHLVSSPSATAIPAASGALPAAYAHLVGLCAPDPGSIAVEQKTPEIQASFPVRGAHRYTDVIILRPCRRIGTRPLSISD